MASNDYEFLTRWRVEAAVEEVSDIIGDPLALARWWPAVYLAVHEVSPADPVTQLGRVISLYTKGWLPYTLQWRFRVIENRSPYGFTIEAIGDFVGRGVWTFTADGRFVDIDFDWRLRADKPLLRTLSFLMKPVFAANHRWAMAMGERSLVLELTRRRAKTDQERAQIPAPPGPTFRRWGNSGTG